jgi:tetratricopeptide (TPR) repeat protein
MYFTITVVAIFAVIFLGALYILRMLRNSKLKSSLKRNMQSGEKENAAEALLALIRKDPFNVEQRVQAANLFMEIGNYSEAILQIESILSMDKRKVTFNEKELNGLLAKCHTELGNIEEAFKAYTIVRRLDPSDSEAHYCLGKLEMQRQRPEEALQYFKKALSLKSGDPVILKEIGIIFHTLKRYADALRVLNMSYKQNPLDAELHFYLAEVHNELENYQAALKHYLKARSDDGHQTISLLKAGHLLCVYKKYPEALKVLGLALKVEGLEKEQLAEIRYEMAEVYLAQGDIERAVKLWQRILSRSPGYRDVRAKLEKYEKLRFSSLLKAYMMAAQSDFLKLCRLIVVNFAKDVVIMRMKNERDSSVEIFAQAVYRHQNMTILFKFFRGSAKVGQLAIREFYEKTRESKATVGICLTSTEFTDEAETYVEGRSIELVSGSRFHNLLNKVEIKKQLQLQ